MTPSTLKPPQPESIPPAVDSQGKPRPSSASFPQDTGWRMQSKSTLDPARTTTRPRGLSDSRLMEIPASSTHPLSRVASTDTTSVPQPGTLAPAATVLPSSSFSDRLGDALKSSFRERSWSATRTTELARNTDNSGQVLASGSESPRFWWSSKKKEVIARPWDSEGSDDRLVPDEQKQNWEQTRKTVNEAVVKVLGVALDVAHTVLAASVPVFEVVPVPGLAPAAELLINIWDTVQEVDTNRLSFLRLTERCACILITLEEEMRNAGASVIKELHDPLKRLEILFVEIQALMKKQSNMPFLKRYLKRDEILSQIDQLNRQLDQELQILGPSFQIRTVKVIQEFAAGMDARIEVACQRALQNYLRSKTITSSPRSASSPTTPSDSISTCKQLEEILSVQNSKDRQLDQYDLIQQIGTLLQTGSDSAMLEFLQIPREDILEAIKSMQRYLEWSDAERSRAITGAEPPDSQDALHREFIESGIDSLRRMSETNENLPSWTITRFEIDCGTRIGVGYFSDVYEGVWRGQKVAVKVLRDMSNRRLFVKEVEIWKKLSHPNVLELFGASSASGSPPWFFVSPFAKHGDLGSYLRRFNMREQRGLGIIPSSSSSSGQLMEYIRKDVAARLPRECDLYRFMLEIAMGMDYLHEHGVFHGDLKCANVLVDENYTCVITDFGHSEIRAEIYRMSGKTATRGGTLRWQSPEVMQGLNDLTPAVDVYAYAITCIEILTMGQMPWSLLDDHAVQFIVLKDNGRPGIPAPYCSTPIHELLEQCWQKEPASRPTFSAVVFTMRKIRKSMGVANESPVLASASKPSADVRHSRISMSPTMSPRMFAFNVADGQSLLSRTSIYAATGSPRTSYENEEISQSHSVRGEIGENPIDVEVYAPTPNNSPSTFSETSLSESEKFVEVDFPMDLKALEAKNERRYRLLLTHRYHPSLVLPLWEPTPVLVGAVGYLSKPEGKFVTLFNAVKPCKSPDTRIAGMPSIAGYGKVTIGKRRHETRNAALRGMDAVFGLLSSGKRDEAQTQRASFPLKSGHKAAYMYTESTEFCYLRNLDAPKMWFKTNVDYILEVFGVEHSIQREDLMLVIGTLQAPNYALFVSHDHPDGHVHFHVFHPRQGKPWGTFTTDTKTADEGPSYDESRQKLHQCAYKISTNGDPPKTVLLARLRFKPDSVEPTSL